MVVGVQRFQYLIRSDKHDWRLRLDVGDLILVELTS
jgi:hypothetical protein